MRDKVSKFINEMQSSLSDFKEKYSNISVLCVGTNEIIGDSIGPIIGSGIKHLENEHLQIWGTMQENFDFSNAKVILDSIYNKWENPYIITIDAALSDKKKIGEIVVNKGFIKIGKALNKSICFYSNANINCVVGENRKTENDNLKELKTVESERVLKLSQIVCSGMEKVLKTIYV